MVGRPRSERINIRVPLLRLELELRGGGKHPTDAEIASATGIPKPTYSGFKHQVQRKRKSPTLGHLISLARYFGVPLEAFFCGNDDPLNCAVIRTVHGCVRRTACRLKMGRPVSMRHRLSLCYPLYYSSRIQTANG